MQQGAGGAGDSDGSDAAVTTVKVTVMGATMAPTFTDHIKDVWEENATTIYSYCIYVVQYVARALLAPIYRVYL